MLEATPTRRPAIKLIWAATIVLLILHQDFWLWENRSLVFGFMPVGLAYHALYSILTALLWAMAVKFAWPTTLEAWAEDDDGAQETT